MVTSTSSTSSALETYFSNLLKQTLEYEKKQRLYVLEDQRDAIDVKKSIYTDLQSQLTSLRTQTKSLWSKESSYALSGATRNATVTSELNGTTVLSATASSDAVEGSYEITDISLSSKHRVSSNRQSSSTSALGYSGTITLNGREITVNLSDTLYSIASKINDASYEDGKGVTASVVDQRLIIESEESGADNAITANGTVLEKLGILNTEGAFLNELSEAKNASFKVNGLTVERSSNTGIDDVIDGVTLNFASDAEGQSATLKIENDVSSMKSAITAFVTKFNSLQSYLTQKLTTTKNDDGSYTRGALLGDSSARMIRSSLVDLFSANLNSGTYTKMLDIGLDLSKGFQIKISDSSKLEDALENNLDAVKIFLDSKMSAMDSLLEQYVGDDGTMNYTLSNITDQRSRLDTRITRENARLVTREKVLTDYYLNLQETLDSLQNSSDLLYALSSYYYS